MTMCPFCDYVYDESEYSRCPRCTGDWKMVRKIVYVKRKNKKRHA